MSSTGNGVCLGSGTRLRAAGLCPLWVESRHYLRKRTIWQSVLTRRKMAPKSASLFFSGQMTTLILASTKRYFGFGDRNDHVVLEGGRCLGRIFQAPQAPSGRPWFCTITAMDFKPSTHNRGYSATREETTVDFKTLWLSATAER